MEDVKKKFVETKLSKLIVFENNIDHIKGYIHQLDLFKGALELTFTGLGLTARRAGLRSSWRRV